jgi:LacI family transcriptional regulator
MSEKKSRSRPANLSDVAERSGFAVSTVSQILSGRFPKKYPKETQNKVLAVARQLNYHPHASARSMRSGRSNLIAVISFNSSLEIGRRAMARLPIEINQAGFDYFITDINWFGGSVDRVLREMISARVEGVVISQMLEAFGRNFVEMFHQAGIPVVGLLGDDRLGIPVVQYDMQTTVLAMSRHLQCVGHRHLILFSTNLTPRTAIERKEGFRMALAGRGPCIELPEAEFFSQWPRLTREYAGRDLGVILVQDMQHYEHSMQNSYYEAGRRLFLECPLPGAILCRNDRGAFGLLAAATETGVRVPEQVAVTGAENDRYGRFPAYSLTTVHFDIERACSETIELLVSKIRQENNDAASRRFFPDLVLRQSCGRLIGTGDPAEIIVPLDPLARAQELPGSGRGVLKA